MQIKGFPMITVKDMDEVIHDKCPRCSELWRHLKDPDYIVCNGCGMMACLSHRNLKKYFLTISFETISGIEYTIYWYNAGCMVEMANGDGEVKSDIHLPLLPYDISYDKLKTYLVFS